MPTSLVWSAGFQREGPRTTHATVRVIGKPATGEQARYASEKQPGSAHHAQEVNAKASIRSVHHEKIAAMKTENLGK
jgi:hypothetical protein